MARRTKVVRFTELGGRGVKLALTDTRDTEQVFWSPQHNSYVVSHDPQGWWTKDGVPCSLFSVNGIGEIRWNVLSREGATNGDTDAIDYFGLTWHGWRGE
jgi:hypothetical protein